MSDAEYWDATPLQVRARFARWQLQQHREWYRVAHLTAALFNASGFRKEGAKPADPWDYCSSDTRRALNLRQPNVHPDYKQPVGDVFAAMDEYSKVIGGLNNQAEIEARKNGGNPDTNQGA